MNFFKRSRLILVISFSFFLAMIFCGFSSHSLKADASANSLFGAISGKEILIPKEEPLPQESWYSGSGNVLPVPPSYKINNSFNTSKIYNSSPSLVSPSSGGEMNPPPGIDTNKGFKLRGW